MSVKERVKWGAVAPGPRAVCFAARSALSLPGTPTWEGTHCRTMSVPRVMSWWHTTTISLTTSSLEDWLLRLMACSADSESEKNDTAIDGWHRSLNKFKAIRMASNSAVKIDTRGSWYFLVTLPSCGTTNAAPTPSVVMDPSVYTQIERLYWLLISSLAVICKIRGLSDFRSPAISNSMDPIENCLWPHATWQRLETRNLCTQYKPHNDANSHWTLNIRSWSTHINFSFLFLIKLSRLARHLEVTPIIPTSKKNETTQEAKWNAKRGKTNWTVGVYTKNLTDPETKP